LSELRQIFTEFDNFWHRDSQDDRIMVIYIGYIYCPPDIIYVNALPCKTQMLQIVTLHDYTVIISVRFLTCALSILQRAPWDLIILWY